MPDNNGNPIVNPMSYNAGNSDLNSSISDLRLLMLDLMSVVQSLGSAIKESSYNTEKTVRSYERITAKTTNDLKETISKNKEVFEHLLTQSLKNHEELQRKSDLGSENAAKVIEALGSKFDEYKKIKENLIKIEEQYVSLNDVIEATTLKSRELTKQHSEVTDNIAKLQADNVNGKNDDILDEQYDLLDTLNNQISELNKSLIGYKDELADVTDIKMRVETQTRNSKDYQYVSDVIDRAANANEKELGQIAEEIKDRDKKEDRREKAKSAREFKIANELTECFDDGLFKLGTNLSDTFKKATNEHLKGTRGSLLGEIAAFAEKSLFSVMDYQTQKVTDAISSLQASFESTGMELSRAILVDRDEIAAEYQDVANELKAQGYDKALSVTDLVGYEAQIARAGITNEDLIHEIALEFGKVSAKTGVGLPDLLSDEILLDIQSFYKDSGGNRELVNSAMEDLANSIINGVDAVDSATGISQGKIQEIATSYFKNIGKFSLEDATNVFQAQLSSQLGLGQYSGGTEIFQRLISGLESARSGNVSEDILSIISSDVITRENYEELVRNGNYLGAMEDMIRNISTLSERDTTNTVLNWLGVSADDWRNLTANKDVDELIAEIEKAYTAMQQGGQSAEVQRREELVTEGRTLTVEQGLKNQALADTAGMWGEAVQTGIPEAANMLKDSIEATNSGIQSAISWGVEKLVGVLTGGSIFSGLTGIGGGAGGISSGIGATLGKGGPAIGLGPTITAALTSFAAGYGIGTAFDNLTGLSDIISDSIVGDVKGTQDAINNLKQVEEDNQAKNTMYQNTLQASIDDIKLSSEIIKQNLQDNISDISKGITDMRDSKEVVGKTVKSVMERGESFYDSKTGGQTTLAQLYQSTTGKDYTTASESDLASWYENEDIQEHLKVAEADRVIEDITQAQQNASIDANRVARETARTMLSDAMSDGEISYFEYQEAEKNLAEFMAKAGLSAEEQKSFRNMMGQEYRQAYTSLNGYNAAKQVFEHIKSLTANLDISDATEKTNEIQRIAKAVKTGTYEGDMGNITSEILALARPYMDLEGGYNEFTALTLKGDTDPYTMYLPENVTPLAVGIDYVPYDEFPALLHKGERVQTAAEARLEDLADSVYYDTVNNTVTNTSVDGLNTTNNSIKDGFNTTTDNQEIIIEALKIIVNALTTPTTSSNNNDVFESITNNKIALRSNNIARLTSYH